jgi:hypothetical protein
MDEKTKALIGALVDLFPPDLTIEELHEFTGAPIGTCVHVLREVRELRLQEQLEWVDGISSEIVRRSLELLPRAA